MKKLNDFSKGIKESLLKTKTILETKEITEKLKNEIVNKWESLGLLESALNKHNLSIAFEIVTYYMLTSDFGSVEYNKNFSNEFEKHIFAYKLERVIYPIINKIFIKNTDEKDMEISDIIEKVEKIYNTYLNLDHEAEYCNYFSNNFEF